MRDCEEHLALSLVTAPDGKDLETETQAEADLAGSADCVAGGLGGCNSAEGGAIRVAVGVGEVRRVTEVEGLGPEFNIEPFGDKEPAKETEVRIDDSRSAHGIAANGAEAGTSGPGEGAGIEPGAVVAPVEALVSPPRIDGVQSGCSGHQAPMRCEVFEATRRKRRSVAEARTVAGSVPATGVAHRRRPVRQTAGV